MNKKIEHLNGYFIIRFFLVMGMILVSEALINAIVSQGILPALNNYPGAELLTGSMNSSQRFALLLQILVYLLGRMIVSVLAGVLPRPVFLFIQSFVHRIEPEYGIKVLENAELPILLLTVGILLLYVLPYIAGILVYSWIVIHKVEEIREYDREQREKFIKKRNLLLSDITHDLKTPITTISGYAQALNEGMIESPEKKKEYLRAIYAKSTQLNRLISVLFDYVKLDSEYFELKTGRVNLGELLREIAAETYPEIEAAGMEFLVDIPEKDCPAMIDSPQFSRAVTNLLVNAVRHNRRGTTICLSLREAGEAGFLSFGNWLIQIADTGEEIDAGLSEHLFEPFVMGDESRSSRSGSGLGLSVAAKLAAMHGGKLTLKQPAEAPYVKSFCIELPKITEDSYSYE